MRVMGFFVLLAAFGAAGAAGERIVEGGIGHKLAAFDAASAAGERIVGRKLAYSREQFRHAR
jgi:hypothetical protein